MPEMDQFKVLTLCGERYLQQCIETRRKRVWKLVSKLSS